MRNTVLLIVGLLMFAPGPAQAMEDGDQALQAMDEVEAYEEEALDPAEQANENVRTLIESYLADHGRKFDGPGVWLGSGVQTVDVSSGNRDWGKHRALAYQKAWAQIQQEFIRFQMNETRTEMIQKLYADASGTVPQFEAASYTGSDAVDEFIDKSGAYLSSKLDAALVEAGVDPQEYERANAKQRKKLLEDSLRSETITRSFGKLGGMWPLKTFIGSVDGRYAVGVVAMQKPAFVEIAEQIGQGQIPQASSKAGSPIGDRVSSDKKQLANSFGVLLVRDENGYPALVSFGQWAVNSKSGNPAIRARFKDAALKQARSQADAALATFLRGTANFTNRSVVGSTIEEYADVDRSGYVESGETTVIEDMLDEVLSVRANVNLSGLRDLRTWSYRHPESGHQLVGVVRVWTAEQAMAAKVIRDGPKREVQPQRQGTSGYRASEGTSSAQSPDYADPSEF